MSIDIYEKFAIGYCIEKPSLSEQLTSDMISSPALKELLKTIQLIAKTSGDTAILPPLLYAEVGNKPWEFKEITRFWLESFLDWKEKAKVNATNIDQFPFLFRKLLDNRKRDSLLKMIAQAEKMIAKGEDSEAIMLLKTMQLPATDVVLSTTLQQMVDSVKDTIGFKTGVRAIDKYTGGFHRGNILTLAGDTGSMKTTASLWLVLEILKANKDFKGMYFEKEMPIKDLARRIVSNALSIDDETLMNASEKERQLIQKQLVEELTAEQEDVLSRLWIVPSNDFDNVADMFSLIETYKPDVWVLDFITQIGIEQSSGGDFNSIVMKNAQALKKIVQTTDSFGIILSQVVKGITKRIDKRIVQDDIEWSGTIKHISAYILSTFFPTLYYTHSLANPDMFFLTSLKNRFKKNFVISLSAIPEYATFTEPDLHKQSEYQQWYAEYSVNFERV